jgi:hypothetical protein
MVRSRLIRAIGVLRDVRIGGAGNPNCTMIAVSVTNLARMPKGNEPELCDKELENDVRVQVVSAPSRRKRQITQGTNTVGVEAAVLLPRGGGHRTGVCIPVSYRDWHIADALDSPHGRPHRQKASGRVTDVVGATASRS